jgi:hypothetical protein
MRRTHPERRLRLLLLPWLAWAVACLAPAPAAALEQRFGLGLHYWKTVDDLADHPLGPFDESGVAWVASYQLVPVSFLKLQIDLEFFPQGFLGSGEEAWSPQGYLVLGRSLYAAAGAGWVYSHGLEGDLSDIFYAARIGTDLRAGSRFRLDLNANYRFSEWSQLGRVDTDLVTLGTVLRLAF